MFRVLLGRRAVASTLSRGVGLGISAMTAYVLFVQPRQIARAESTSPAPAAAPKKPKAKSKPKSPTGEAPTTTADAVAVAAPAVADPAVLSDSEQFEMRKRVMELAGLKCPCWETDMKGPCAPDMLKCMFCWDSARKLCRDVTDESERAACDRAMNYLTSSVCQPYCLSTFQCREQHPELYPPIERSTPTSAGANSASAAPKGK